MDKSLILLEVREKRRLRITVNSGDVLILMVELCKTSTVEMILKSCRNSTDANKGDHVFEPLIELSPDGNSPPMRYDC